MSTVQHNPLTLTTKTFKKGSFLTNLLLFLEQYGGTDETIERATGDAVLLSKIAKILVGTIWTFAEQPFELATTNNLLYANDESELLNNMIHAHKKLLAQQRAQQQRHVFSLVQATWQLAPYQTRATIFELDAFATLFPGTSDCKVIGAEFEEHVPVLYLGSEKRIVAEDVETLVDDKTVFLLVRNVL